jgi:hypothetical protein
MVTDMENSDEEIPEIEVSYLSGRGGKTLTKIVRYIDEFVEVNNLGDVTVGTGYVLFTNPEGKDTFIGPDVAFVRKERAPEGLPKSGYAPSRPILL